MNEIDTDTTPAPSKDGWPERYFAVIFTAQRTLSDEDMYSLTSDRMVELAQAQPGFLGVESVRGDDGIGITVSYWRDRDVDSQLAGQCRASCRAADGAPGILQLVSHPGRRSGGASKLRCR